MKIKCDDCERPKTECPACKAAAQARADRAYDESKNPTLADEISHEQRYYGGPKYD